MKYKNVHDIIRIPDVIAPKDIPDGLLVRVAAALEERDKEIDKLRSELSFIAEQASGMRKQAEELMSLARQETSAFAPYKKPCVHCGGLTAERFRNEPICSGCFHNHEPSTETSLQPTTKKDQNDG